MPRIPDEIVQQVLGATDIVDLIASYGLDLKRAGADFKTHCPFHNEKTPSFNVSPGRQSYRDHWTCIVLCNATYYEFQRPSFWPTV